MGKRKLIDIERDRKTGKWITKVRNDHVGVRISREMGSLAEAKEFAEKVIEDKKR